jgi:hypothetical protein
LPDGRDVRRHELIALPLRGPDDGLSPFEAVWTCLRPQRPNSVQLDGGDTAARRPLVAFPRAIELELPGRSLDPVFADRTTILIPCVSIDLQPANKEPSQ